MLYSSHKVFSTILPSLALSVLQSMFPKNKGEKNRIIGVSGYRNVQERFSINDHKFKTYNITVNIYEKLI